MVSGAQKQGKKGHMLENVENREASTGLRMALHMQVTTVAKNQMAQCMVLMLLNPFVAQEKYRRKH